MIFDKVNRLRVFTRKLHNIAPVFHNASKYQNKIAIRDVTGQHSYNAILAQAQHLSSTISRQLNGKVGERVLFLCPNDASYVVTIWAIWMSGQIAVPLSPQHPQSLLEYYCNDTNSRLLVTSAQYEQQMSKLSKKVNLFVLDENLLNNKSSIITTENALPLDFYQKNDAMILYTSGTTGKPKGVILTHKNISTQVETLTKAWKWSENDTILHTLPLHHVHGTVNALFCPLAVGATTLMMPKFNAKETWQHLLNQQQPVTVFMAVPTIYSKLIEEFDSRQSDCVKQTLTAHVRLMVSGSAPLPVPLYNKWLEISGHRLLERYGMTEIGMCLSNLYDSNREPGYVGLPLPSVTVAIADPDTGDILLQCSNINGEFSVTTNHLDEVTGELLVKGDSVFKEYYNKPTAQEFQNGWFKTGDICQYVDNKIRMLGRKSADIIKSGGYKISALQIETILVAHPGVKECAVLGVTDDVYGERVTAVIVPTVAGKLTLPELKEWAADKMPKYWIPSLLKVVEEIPKNAMGKVNKKELKKTLF